MKPRPLTPDEEASYARYLAPQRARFEARERARNVIQDHLSGDQPWLIALTATNAERRATLGLRDVGWEVWQPGYWQPGRTGMSRRDNVCRWRSAAAGVLLIRHGNALAWTELASIDGVRGLAMVGERPGEAPVTEINRWRSELEAMRDRSMPMVDDAYRVGGLVRIVEGPFLGHTAVVERLLGRGAVMVAVTVFGRSTGLQIGRDAVEAV